MKTETVKWFFITFLTVMLLDAFFDCWKWALGRYSAISPLLSVLVIVGSSALLASVVEIIHKVRRIRERCLEQYLHHKAKVWVRKGQKGNHRKASLCTDCAFFEPDSASNCLIESVVHVTSRDNHLALVVWECPKFEAKDAKK